MCPLIKDILLGFCYQGNIVPNIQRSAGVPNTSFEGFWFLFWSDDEVFSSGDEFAHTFSLLHLSLACLFFCLSHLLYHIHQPIKNVNQLLKLATLTFFTEPTQLSLSAAKMSGRVPG